ncbi:V-type ATPase subunit [Deinococcus peraridilitoris]|uniref:V-type ATP synthase subunit C n=1 Tax=Deinococcus peraridilitoris (strain DSM 19664 / LMG 22246 / CIP 109416 / KR-200) TaxID=937777 RepID=L0A313_DEIPD|nr:V-type ATPase subunit [Deinococcus peraridilitoris]AFZ67834.1 archaeal/vacuolar-type H+-ATPase subunit C [Deinococcus peraridilitoris DSM 19664]
MPDDYGYINARIKVMRTKLLDGRMLDAALGAQSYPEFLRVLSESELSADLGDATAQGAGLAELDAALSRNFFTTANKVVHLADGTARDEIGILLQKWDLNNLKTLARGLTTGRSAEDILASLVPGGTLKTSALTAAANSGDLASATQAITLSGHPLARSFRAGVGAYNASGRLLDLEVTLDQGYYRGALRVARGSSLRRYLAREIDINNVLTARAMRGETPDASLFVPGGRSLSAADFPRLASGDATGAGDLAPIVEAPTLEEAETAARRLIDTAARDVAMGDPLGVGVAVDFLRRKEIEIAKLRLIGRGKFYGLPAEQLRREVASE